MKGCQKDFRSDKLREHFQNQVLWNNEGNPVVKTSAIFKNAPQIKQEHYVVSGEQIYLKVCQVLRGWFQSSPHLIHVRLREVGKDQNQQKLRVR